MTHSCETRIILYTPTYTHHKNASTTHGSAFGEQVSLAQLSHRNKSIFVRSPFGKPSKWFLAKLSSSGSHLEAPIWLSRGLPNGDLTSFLRNSLPQLSHHKTTKENYIPSQKAKHPDKRDPYSDCALLSWRNIIEWHSLLRDSLTTKRQKRRQKRRVFHLKQPFSQKECFPC